MRLVCRIDMESLTERPETFENAASDEVEWSILPWLTRPTGMPLNIVSLRNSRLRGAWGALVILTDMVRRVDPSQADSISIFHS